MAKRKNTGQGELFTMSAEELDARMQARIARRGAINILGSKRRLPFVESNPPAPLVIPEAIVHELGRRLRVQDRPLMDGITKSYDVEPNEESIRAYIGAANSRSSRRAETKEERMAIHNSMQRQWHHVAADLQRQVGTKLGAAKLSRAALGSIQQSVREDSVLDPEAANYAAAAIEDFGFCLREYPNITEPTPFDNLPETFEHIGVYAVNDPGNLRQHPLVLRLVRIEQAKRVDYWGVRYAAVVDTVGDHRTVQEKQNNLIDQELIQRFAGNGTTEAGV